MTRSPNSELAERINAALSLQSECPGKEEIVLALMCRFGVSRRQAYRYIQEAQKTKVNLPIPEEKVVFTVKLPKSLVSHLRQFANSTGDSLSNLATQALEALLEGRGYGR
jgi:predicted DNA-binding transcriptional regulator YafY